MNFKLIFLLIIGACAHTLTNLGNVQPEHVDNCSWPNLTTQYVTNNSAVGVSVQVYNTLVKQVRTRNLTNITTAYYTSTRSIPIFLSQHKLVTYDVTYGFSMLGLTVQAVQYTQYINALYYYSYHLTCSMNSTTLWSCCNGISCGPETSTASGMIAILQESVLNHLVLAWIGLCE